MLPNEPRQCIKSTFVWSFMVLMSLSTNPFQVQRMIVPRLSTISPTFTPFFVLECNIFLQTAKFRHIIEFCQISVTQAKHVKQCLEEDLGRLSSAALTYIQSTLIWCYKISTTTFRHIQTTKKESQNTLHLVYELYGLYYLDWTSRLH